MKKTAKFLASILCVAAMGGSILPFVGCGGSDPTAGEVRISGSSSVTPLMEKLRAEYLKKNKNVDIEIQQSDSGTGIKDTQEGKNDIGMASRALKDTETGIVSESICLDGVALVVNPSCTLENVTGPQVFELYINGTAIESVSNALSRESGSGTRGAFDELIKDASGTTMAKYLEAKDANGALLHSNFATCVTVQNSNGAMKSTIASNSAGNTVGYISMGTLDATVKALKYGGVAATVENVLNGTYKLSRPFNIVYKSKESLSPAAKAFIDYIMSTEGQKIVTDNGYISKK